MKQGLHLFGSSPTARRREVRRTIPRRPHPWRQWFNQREASWASIFFLLFTLLAGGIAILADERPRYAVQEIIPQTVVARVAFEARDEAKTIDAQKIARDNTPNVYVANTRFFDQVRDRLNALETLAADPTYQTIDQIPQVTRDALRLTPEALTELHQLIVNGQPTPMWDDSVKPFLKSLPGIVVLTPEQARIERGEQSKRGKIIVKPTSDTQVAVFDNAIMSNSDDEATAIRSAVTDKVDHCFRKPLRNCIVELVMQQRAETYEYDDAASKQRQEADAHGVPPVFKVYAPNDVIVPAGAVLTAVDTDRLDLERHAYQDALEAQSPWLPRLVTLGRVGMIGVIGLILWGYVLAYNRRIVRNPVRGLALTGLMLLTLLLAVAVTANNPRWVYFSALWPTLLTGIVLAIAYDRRFAMAVGGIHALLVLLVLELPVDFGLVMIVGMGTAVSQLNEVGTRSKLFLTGLGAGVAMALTVVTTGLVSWPLLFPAKAFLVIRHNAMLALSTGVVTGLIVEAALPAIETLFRVTTAVKLKELNEASHPLLRRLAQEAPGTYQHSLRMADMAESAANAIHADALLCKVGAMYHDIGKINKPLYFVENQGGGPNRHNKLSPAMSLLIIVGHVKDGVEMAREYRIPAPLRHFIESHHGTTLVEYFYHAARQQRDAQAPGPGPSEFEFRYPGPKPQTREAAILMLCDGVEGAARAMPEPSAPRLEALVHAMAQKRLTDGQFDQCNLTLQELHKIEVAVTKTLCAMYHGRIAYPKDAAARQDLAPASGTDSRPAAEAS